MIESKYIYDLSEAQMRSMNTMSYPDGLLFLLNASTKLNAKLNDVHYLEQDFHRIDKVVKAIKHNTQKLKDIYYDDFIKQQSTGALKIHPNQSSIDDFLKDWFMKKFYKNSDFAIYTDKKNEIVDLYNKVTDTKTRFMTDTLDKAIIDTVSNEVLLKAKQAIDVELNRRIDRGDFKWQMIYIY